MPLRGGMRVVLVVALLLCAACGGDGAGRSENGAPEQHAGGGGGQGQGGGEKGQQGKERDGSGKEEKPDEKPRSEGKVIRVQVAGGEVSGVESTVAVPLGADLSIVVRSDEADEVRVHGYNLFDDVAPGQPAEINLTADIPGEFEVELEQTHLPLFSLQVQ
jgi:hypothetical protein